MHLTMSVSVYSTENPEVIKQSRRERQWPAHSGPPLRLPARHGSVSPERTAVRELSQRLGRVFCGDQLSPLGSNRRGTGHDDGPPLGLKSTSD